VRAIAVERRAHRDRLTHWAVLRGVVQQVEQHLPYAVGIRAHGDVVGPHDSDVRLRGLRLRAERVHDFAHERREWHRLSRKPRRAAAGGAPEEQDVLHELNQPPRFADDDVACIFDIATRANAAEPEGIAEQENLREWGPELVRDRGHELGAESCQLHRTPRDHA